MERSVQFTINELWLLNDVVRHELAESKRWAYPPASKELNDEIAFAILACETNKLDEFTLFLSEGDLLLLDYLVRRDHKTPEGARGKDILLKVFAARFDLIMGFPVEQEVKKLYDETEVRKNANDSSHTDDHAHDYTIA